uniref:G-protein coupled receptors family 1 profile domain-containing protein n=1 Tax=Schistosoma haematobium TaxID=6185 RepID=A0A095A3E4_SCHHA
MNQTFINLTSLRSDTNLTLYGENNIEIYSAFFVQTTICIIGAILNIINVIVLSHKQFEATPYLFMTALSLTDTGILLVHLPSGWARCGTQLRICQTEIYKQLRVILLYYVTYIGFGLGNILEASSVWITVLISAERYIIMKWPHLGKLYFARYQGKWQVFITVCIAVVFNFPLFFTLKINTSVVQGPNNTKRHFHYSKLTWFGQSPYYHTFTWIRFICVQCIPLITLCIVNFMLLRLTWSSYHNQKAHQLSQQSYMRRLSLPMTSGIDENNETCCQSIPQALAYVHILELIVPRSCIKCRPYSALYKHFSQLLCLITSTTNFFLYVGLNRNFRECLTGLCHTRRKDKIFKR